MQIRRHSIALLTLGALTAAWLLPVLRHFATAIPGDGPGDNVAFVWDLWWMRYVLHHPGSSFFFTPYLFHPFGVDLTLHTHTALPAFVAAVAGPASLAASQNLLIVSHVYLNFVCSYALAFRAARHVAAALIAALVFGCSPFVAAHLTGHFNLVAAWVLPLVCLLAARTAERLSIGRGALSGTALAAVAYVDYYLFIFAAALAAIHLASAVATVSVHDVRPSRTRRGILAAIVALLVVDAIVIAAILLTRTERFDLGPIHVSIRSVSNPASFAWLLLAAGACVWLLPRVQVTRAPLTRSHCRAIAAFAVAALAMAAPLAIHLIQLWNAGGYATQRYRWRSAPGGVDAATFVLGNPFNLWWKEHALAIYASMQIDPIEGSAWVPAGAVILALIAARACWRDRAVRTWIVAGGLFLVWALGPWLTASGVRTPLMLPAIALRYAPLLANARIPGRAMVVVSLASAMLAAIGFASLARQTRRRKAIAFGLAVLTALECAPAPPPMYPLRASFLYTRIREAGGAGAVCELPLGVRDGFGETGRFDSSALFHQTIHERPLVGGFVARLPPHIVTSYLAMPVIGSLLRLSGGGPLSAEPRAMSPSVAAAELRTIGVRLIVLDTHIAPPDLIRYVESAIALRVIAEDNGRILYEVQVPPS